MVRLYSMHDFVQCSSTPLLLIFLLVSRNTYRYTYFYEFLFLRGFKEKKHLHLQAMFSDNATVLWIVFKVKNHAILFMSDSGQSYKPMSKAIFDSSLPLKKKRDRWVNGKSCLKIYYHPLQGSFSPSYLVLLFFFTESCWCENM